MKQIYLVYIVVLRGQKRDTSDERHAGLLFAPLENGLYYSDEIPDLDWCRARGAREVMACHDAMDEHRPLRR